MIRLAIHFIRRDFLDFLVGWVVLTITTVASWLLRSEPTAVLYLGGYSYFIFSMVVSIYVWTSNRAYLLSLPVSRTTMFAISAARDAASTLPLFALGVALFPAFMLLIGKAHAPSGARGFVDACGFVGVSVILLKVVFLMPLIEGERMRTTAGRSRRFAMIVTILVRLAVDFLFFSIWFVGFAFIYSGRYPLVYFVVPLLPAPYFAWKLARFRRRWLWD